MFFWFWQCSRLRGFIPDIFPEPRHRVKKPILSEPLTDDVAKELAELADGMSIGQIADCVDKIIVKAVKKKENITTEQLLEGFKSVKENN